MSTLLLDTDGLAWVLLRTARLSAAARVAIAGATAIGVSSISVFEITRKVRIGKWPAMSPVAPNLEA